MIRVAGYCRVSTDKSDQTNSFISQQRYFREYIEHHPEWELFDIYADEGITGTSTKKRVQFNRMMHDAYNKQFQLILTKEVSRFSRNILDTIAFTRELKNLGIGVVFMSDGFSSLDPDAELRLSIMGSIAQEESRKTSERVKWGQTRKMERGVVFGKSLLGYDVHNGTITVNREGAKIVERIFYQYGVEKKGSTVIARELHNAGYRTAAGSSRWRESTILKILKNEKYVGDLVQKKTITPDYLTHEKKYNHGEEELIIIRNHHEAIVSRELWDLVQKEIEIRHRIYNVSKPNSNRYVFSGKIICVECGARFIARTKTRKDGSSYRRWGCYNASRYGKRRKDSQGNMTGCDIGKQIRDELAVDMLCCVFQNLNIDYDQILHRMKCIVSEIICYGDSPVKTAEKLERSIHQISEKKTKSIDLYLSGLITQEEFGQLKQRYNSEIDSLKKHLQSLADKSCYSMERIIKVLESIITGKTGSDSYLKMLLEYMRVYRDGTVEIKLYCLDTIWRFQLFKE